METEGRSELSTALALLADRRRRHVLYHLWNASGPVSLPALARAVAERLAGRSGSGSFEAFVRDVECSLVHVHLPKLEDVGVVRTDDRLRVELVAAERLSPFLAEAARIECREAAEG